MSSPSTSYWCYSCSRFVRASPGEPISCPDCHGGFLEAIGNTPASTSARRHSRITSSGDASFPADPLVDLGSRRNRRASVGHGSPFNPVIVLRASVADAPRSDDGGGGGGNGSSSFELFYDDGAGTGLRPLPPSMSNFLMGSGFDQLLDQLTQMENIPMGVGRSYDSTPASKAAVESLPTITIADSHVGMDSHCAVCTDALELGEEAREMPCRHIFHQDCILPWLSLRNSCPVCRHELPADVGRRGGDGAGQGLMGSEENSAGLTIWRLPGGGFAVGRFTGVRRAGDRELPVVYGEMDRSLSSGGVPSGILWPPRRSRSRERGGVGGMVHNLFSMFRCFGPPSSSSTLSSSRLRLPSPSAESLS